MIFNVIEIVAIIVSLLVAVACYITYCYTKKELSAKQTQIESLQHSISVYQRELTYQTNEVPYMTVPLCFRVNIPNAAFLDSTDFKQRYVRSAIAEGLFDELWSYMSIAQESCTPSPQESTLLLKLQVVDLHRMGEDMTKNTKN